MECPVCKVPLTMSERQGIEIDYCSQCRGVWLDRGELDKILERSTSAAPAPVAARPRNAEYEPRREEYSSHRRRKNWLEDLFD